MEGGREGEKVMEGLEDESEGFEGDLVEDISLEVGEEEDGGRGPVEEGGCRAFEIQNALRI